MKGVVKMASENKRVSLFLGEDVINYYKQRAAGLEIPFSALMRLALREFMHQDIEDREHGKKDRFDLDFPGQIDLLKL